MFNVRIWLFEMEMQEDAGPGSSTFLSILAEMSFQGLALSLHMFRVSTMHLLPAIPSRTPARATVTPSHLSPTSPCFTLPAITG